MVTTVAETQTTHHKIHVAAATVAMKIQINAVAVIVAVEVLLTAVAIIPAIVADFKLNSKGYEKSNHSWFTKHRSYWQGISAYSQLKDNETAVCSDKSHCCLDKPGCCIGEENN